MADKLKVFISSKIEEFLAIRDSLFYEFEKWDIKAFVWEISIGARATTPHRAYKKELEESDIYVGIFGLKKSNPTKEEFEYAGDLSIPRLIYVQNLAGGESRDKDLETFIDKIEEVYKGFNKNKVTKLKNRIVRDVLNHLVDIHREHYRFFTANLKYGTHHEKEFFKPLANNLEIQLSKFIASGMSLPEGDNFDYRAGHVRDFLKAIGYEIVEDVKNHGNHADIIIEHNKRSGVHICVRVVFSPVKFSHVKKLKEIVDKQRYHEGWLVGDKLIDFDSKHSSRHEFKDIRVCRFNKLIEEEIELANYFNNLVSLVKKINPKESYVNLSGTKLQYSNKFERVKQSIQHIPDVNNYINGWLWDITDAPLAILGEFGSGKTTLVFNTAYELVQRYQEMIKLKKGEQPTGPLPRIPIIFRLKDYEKLIMEGSFSILTKEIYSLIGNLNLNGLRINIDTFLQLGRMHRLLLIFEGFDEMSFRVNEEQIIKNFDAISELIVPGSKVILTCRKEHFQNVEQERNILEREANEKNDSLTKSEVLYINNLNRRQIREILLTQTEPKIVDEILRNMILVDLAQRPYYVDLVLEAFLNENGSRGDLTNLSNIFYRAVERKLNQDHREESVLVEKEEKWLFLIELARYLFNKGKTNIDHEKFVYLINKIFKTPINELDHWDHEMRARSILIRKERDYYSFGHPCLYEYFVALGFGLDSNISPPPAPPSPPPPGGGGDPEDRKHLVEEVLVLEREVLKLLDKIRRFKLSRGDDDINYEGFWGPDNPEPPDTFFPSFGRKPIPAPILQHLAHMGIGKTFMRKVIERTKDANLGNVGFAGGNAATFLGLERDSFQEMDCQGADLTGANLQRLNLSNVNFQKTILKEATISGCNLENADFTSAVLKDIRIKESEKVYDLAWSPDSQFLLSGGIDINLTVWLSESWKSHKTLDTKNSSISVVRWSPCNQYIVCGTYGNGLLIWDTVNFQIKDTHDLTSGWIDTLDLTGDSEKSRLAIGDIICSIEQLGEGEQTLANISLDEVKKKDISISQFNHTGELLATVPRNSNEIAIIVLSGNSSYTLKKRLSGVGQICFAPNSNIMVSCPAFPNQAESTLVWDLDKKDCIGKLNKSSNVQALTISPDGQHVIGGFYETGDIAVWDILSGKRLQTIRKAHSDTIRSIKFSPNMQYLATAGDDGTIRIWDGASYKTKLKPIIELVLRMSCKDLNLQSVQNLSIENLKLFSDRGAILDKEQKEQLTAAFERSEDSTEKELNITK